jgi:hypothetical protein
MTASTADYYGILGLTADATLTVALDGAGLEVPAGMVFGLLARTGRARPRWSASWPRC